MEWLKNRIEILILAVILMFFMCWFNYRLNKIEKIFVDSCKELAVIKKILIMNNGNMIEFAKNYP